MAPQQFAEKMAIPVSGVKSLLGLLEKVRSATHALSSRRFYAIKRQTHGMLPVPVYKKFYSLIYGTVDLDIIEVGGAAGAASIVIALAMQESGKQSKLIVVEKCVGGSRSDFGDYDANLALMERNFKKYGVEGNILLYPRELTYDRRGEVLELVQTKQIAALIHDADGRLDRDFRVFWPLLRVGGLIVVDDYAERASFQPISARHPQGGVKPLMTYRLLNQMGEWGLFAPLVKVDTTMFGYKPQGADFGRFDPSVCQRIISDIHAERLKAIGGRVSELGRD